MKAVVLLLLVVVASVYAQTTLRFVIDDFGVGAGEHRVEVEVETSLREGDDPIASQSSFTQAGCSGLIGCSRDMQLTAFTGNEGRTGTSEIFTSDSDLFQGEWAVATSKRMESVTIVQYDGQDESINLDQNGLGGIDMTDGGLARGLGFSVISDLPTTYQVAIYSPDGGRCDGDIETPTILGDYDFEDTFVVVTFDDLDGDCDLTDVGAIELYLPGNDALDAIMRSFQVVGIDDPVQPSASPTPLPSAAPSQEMCMCHCPIFTCALIFDPDDDENNAYYFDDDDENRGLIRPPAEAAEDDDDIAIVVDDADSGSASGAATIVASLASIAVVAAIF